MPSSSLPIWSACLLRALAIMAACVAIAHAQLPEARNLNVVQSDRRVALVIGNAAYKSSPLQNPVNDARAMTAKLKNLGFEVIEKQNLTTKQISATLKEFRSRLKPGTEALFFYAGHGLQVKGVNYLPAVDADITAEEDVPYQSINVNQVLEIMEETKTRLNLIFLDACRNNPFSRRFRSAADGLAKVNAPSGTLISFATRPGSVAADGAGQNSLYTEQLLLAMDQSNVPIEQVLKKAAAGVKKASKGQQEPWSEGMIEGEFYFIFNGPTTVNIQQSAPPPTAPAAPMRVLSAAEIEQELWSSIKDSREVSVFEEYLRQYPKGRYVGQAKITLTKLKAEARSSNAPVRPAVTTGKEDGETALWMEVQKGNNKEDYEAYLAQYPKGKYVALAKSRIKKLQDEAAAEVARKEQEAWQTANQSDSEDGYRSYLKGWPAGQYASLAQVRLRKLQSDLAVRQEQELWQQAQAGESAQAVQVYLDKYPNGGHAAAAQEKLSAIRKAEAEREEQEAARVAEQQRKTREEAARGPEWAEADNGADINWAEAKNYCASKGSGWRLPTVAELQSSYQSGHSTPCGSSLIFSFTCKVSSNSRLTGPWFWSNEPYGSSVAWSVDLNYGHRHDNHVEGRSDTRALCVRRP